MSAASSRRPRPTLAGLALAAGDRLFGQRMMRRLAFLEEAQWWDPERLAAERDRRLRELVRVCHAEVPFYRDLMERAGVGPADVRGAGDLPRLPIVTKAMLREAYPDRVRRDTGRPVSVARTSGSTGSNFEVLTDVETLGWHRASFLLALHWAGWRIGEPHLQTGMTLERGVQKRLKDAILRCHYISAFDLRDEALDAALDVLEGRRIRHLWGYPGSLHELARRALARGWNTPLHSVVTWGDNLLPHARSAMERAFGTRVTDTYGCGEGIQIAAQCGTGGVYHVHALDVVVEYVDAEGNPAPAGEGGSLVLTRLHPGPMPLVRYRVGDAGFPAAEARCACGRGFPLLGGVHGRDADTVTTPDGNRLIVHFFTGIVEHYPQVEHFQVVQDDPAAIVLRVVPAEGYSDEVERRLVEHLRERGAAALRIDVERVSEIPLTPGGKRRFVLRRVSGGAP